MLLIIRGRWLSLLLQVLKPHEASFPACRVAIIPVLKKVQDPAAGFPAVETLISLTAICFPVPH